MEQSVTTLVESFRRKGLKITPQRRLIFQALVADHSHPTAEDVYQRVVPSLPDVSRTTVYNTLKELVAQGELVEIDLGEGKTRYDTDISTHHHLLCVNCHALADVHQEFEGLELLPEEAQGYHIVDRQVTFYGYCPACQAST
jgi:Fe2+ or Zn2+ uptake regulation protein